MQGLVRLSGVVSFGFWLLIAVVSDLFAFTGWFAGVGLLICR